MKPKRKGKATPRHEINWINLDDFKSSEDFFEDLPGIDLSSLSDLNLDDLSDLNLDDLPEINLDEMTAWIESIDWVEMGRLVDELLGLNTPQTKPQGHRKAITP